MPRRKVKNKKWENEENKEKRIKRKRGKWEKEEIVMEKKLKKIEGDERISNGGGEKRNWEWLYEREVDVPPSTLQVYPHVGGVERGGGVADPIVLFYIQR